MIRNLIFDFGKVLVNYDFDTFFRRRVPDEGRRRAFVPILCNPALEQEIDREDVPFEELMQSLMDRHPEFRKEMKLFLDHYPDIVTGEVEGMRPLLARLKEEGYRLYGLTNWCSKVHETIRQYGIFRLLDGYVISSEEHLIKPDPSIYRRLCDRYHLVPEECLFTDDRPVNVEGARRIGMAGIVFRDAVQFERDMREALAKGR